MPRQETFFVQQSGELTVEVLKSYDQGFAREAFKNMDQGALQRLWDSMKPEQIYDPSGLPSLSDLDGEGEAFLWDEMLEQAREYDNVVSFFIVNERVGTRVESVFVSPDWPSAETYAKERLNTIWTEE